MDDLVYRLRNGTAYNRRVTMDAQRRSAPAAGQLSEASQYYESSSVQANVAALLVNDVAVVKDTLQD